MKSSTFTKFSAQKLHNSEAALVLGGGRTVGIPTKSTDGSTDEEPTKGKGGKK